MRAWQHWAARRPRAMAARALAPPLNSGQLRSFASSVSKYPTQSEVAVLGRDDGDLSDHDSSRLVCGKCATPISKTQDLVFFKWRSGIHVSSMTDAPLQHLRTDKHWNNDENTWKKHKLHCLACDHAVGSIARVFTSDKILFSAREVAIQMPAHQSPMLSLSGYPSSMLGFSMWSELLLMLESQPQLKSKLQIRRVDNIREVSVEKKELNTLLMLGSDLKSLLDVVDKHITVMNHVNIMTALRRASVLIAAKKKTTPPQAPPRFTVKSEAPEDVLMDLPVNALIDPKVEKARAEALNKRLWKLVDAMEGILNFGIGAIQSPFHLTSLASALWRLNIGRPSILQPLAAQMIKLAREEDPGLGAREAAFISSAVAHLSSKGIRHDSWMRDVLFCAAEVVLKDASVFQDKALLLEIALTLARSMTLTGVFHPEFFEKFFESINGGVLETKDEPKHANSAHFHSHGARRSWQARIYQIHVDNVHLQRGPQTYLKKGERLDTYRVSFEEHEKQLKTSSFRPRHLVASALETMELRPLALRAVGPEGYITDVALTRQKIAIEINSEDAYLSRDPRDDDNLKNDAVIESGFRDHVYTTLPFSDLKARHLEHHGWIVVQLPADEFMDITKEERRVEYLSTLIEIATYSRAQELEADESDDIDPEDTQKSKK